MTYETLIADAFRELENRHLGRGQFDEGNHGYIKVEPKDGQMTITLDPLKTFYWDFDPMHGVEKMEAALKGAGAEEVTTTSQYRKYIHKNGLNWPSGIDGKVYDTNPNDPSVVGGDTNFKRLQFTLPDTLDSVVLLKRAADYVPSLSERYGKSNNDVQR